MAFCLFTMRIKKTQRIHNDTDPHQKDADPHRNHTDPDKNEK